MSGSVLQRLMTLLQRNATTIELDRRDINILRSLNENARKSYRDIAKELRLSRRTISKKIKAMEEAGVIHGYIPRIDAAKVGFDIVAVMSILFCTHERVTLETEKELAKDPAVFAVFGYTGEWECVVMARFRNTTDLDIFVKKAAAHQNVDRICVQVVLNFVKEEKRVPL
jgi:Lrp/AsnC family transcriptional regulator for asnA, asnC and gidA